MRTRGRLFSALRTLLLAMVLAAIWSILAPAAPSRLAQVPEPHASTAWIVIGQVGDCAAGEMLTRRLVRKRPAERRPEVASVVLDSVQHWRGGGAFERLRKRLIRWNLHVHGWRRTPILVIPGEAARPRHTVDLNSVAPWDTL